jgi:hypothetical protein
LSRNLCVFSKPFEPQSTDLLPREAIYKKLDRFQTLHGVWIHGPAGAGKTAATVGYLQARQTAYVWYQVDVMDVKVGIFFRNLAQLADEPATKHSIELPVYDDQAAGSLSSFCGQFFSQFFELFNKPIAMVFDNLHEVDENADLYTALHVACDIAPEHVGFYFLSRLAPIKNLPVIICPINWALFIGRTCDSPLKRRAYWQPRWIEMALLRLNLSIKYTIGPMGGLPWFACGFNIAPWDWKIHNPVVIPYRK